MSDDELRLTTSALEDKHIRHQMMFKGDPFKAPYTAVVTGPWVHAIFTKEKGDIWCLVQARYDGRLVSLPMLLSLIADQEVPCPS